MKTVPALCNEGLINSSGAREPSRAPHSSACAGRMLLTPTVVPGLEVMLLVDGGTVSHCIPLLGRAGQAQGIPVSVASSKARTQNIPPGTTAHSIPSAFPISV